jgi:hypothetical protein
MKVSDIIINNGEEFRIEVVGATREEMVNGELVEGTHVFGEYVNKMRMTKGGKKSIRCGLFIITEGAGSYPDRSEFAAAMPWPTIKRKEK